MITSIDAIAKKYARAFLHTNHTIITPTTIEQCNMLTRLLDKHKNVIKIVSTSNLAPTKKSSYVEHFLTTAGLSKEFALLVNLLIKHNRLFYLSTIVKHVVHQYNKSQSITIFTVTTSHALNEEEKSCVFSFIQQSLPDHTIQAHFDVAPNLISGIRIQSDTLLWERSLPKLLRQIKQTLFHRVAL